MRNYSHSLHYAFGSAFGNDVIQGFVQLAETLVGVVRAEPGGVSSRLVGAFGRLDVDVVRRGIEHQIRNLDHFGKVHEADLADDADDALPVRLRDGQSLPAEFFLLRPGEFLLHMGEIGVGREGDMRERWVGLEYVGIERVRISAGAHKDDSRDFAAFAFGLAKELPS